MPNVTNTLTASISSQDDASLNTPISLQSGNPAYDSSFAQDLRYLSLGVGANVIHFQPSSVFGYTHIYIKNLDPASSISVIWTPNGGAPTTIITLPPGGLIILWLPPSTQASPTGISALTLTNLSATNTCLCEVFYGG